MVKWENLGRRKQWNSNFTSARDTAFMRMRRSANGVVIAMPYSVDPASFDYSRPLERALFSVRIVWTGV